MNSFEGTDQQSLIDLDKAFFFSAESIGFFIAIEKYLISPQNICYGYSLEVPHEELLMSTHNICFVMK